VAGLAGASGQMVLAAVAHTLAPPLPFLPLSLSQALVRAAPGGFATFFIEALGHWALRVAVAGTTVGFLLAGALLGLLILDLHNGLGGRPRLAGVLALLPLWGATVLVYPSNPQSLDRAGFGLAALPMFVAAGVLAGSVYRRLTDPTPTGRPGDVSSMDLARRLVLRSLWFGGLGVLLGVANPGRLLRERPNPGRHPIALPTLSRATTPPSSPADAPFDRIPGLTPEITPNEAFYVVDEEIIDPDIDPRTWRLRVAGLVEHQFRLTYPQLKALPALERYQTLECISNEVGGPLISTARWVGVPLPRILDRAGVKPDALEVVFHAAGGYSDSLPIDQAMDESTLLAIGMNGRTLPREHGFPARLLSVGTYGMKNPKWLVRIDVVGHPYTGFWEGRGWTKRALVKTGSRIDTPGDGGTVAGETTIAGVAFAGDRGVSRVQVSTDGGMTWNEAGLKRELSPNAWRLWRYRFSLSGPGPYPLMVRSYDGLGVPQAAVRADPHPDGASGYHAITVSRGTSS
jgi:DMSO/TMAO reductase YedYZ molybdopterin-dependent catalytic subunit